MAARASELRLCSELVSRRHDDRPLRGLCEADRIAEGIAQRAVDPVEALRWLLGELDSGGTELLVGAAAVLGLEDQTAARPALGDQLADLLRGCVVVCRRPRQH